MKITETHYTGCGLGSNMGVALGAEPRRPVEPLSRRNGLAREYLPRYLRMRCMRLTNFRFFTFLHRILLPTGICANMMLSRLVFAIATYIVGDALIRG